MREPNVFGHLHAGLLRGRRNFLKTAGLASLGLLGFGCAGGGRERNKTPADFSDSTERVSLAGLPRGASVESVIKAVRRAAEAATDFSWLSRGDAVFVKPASNSASRYPSTTSPLAVRAMVRLLLDRGAGRVVFGDKPGVEAVYQNERGQRGSSREVLVKNGLHRAAEEAGAQVHYFDEAGYDAYFADPTAHESHWKGDLLFPNILKEVDHVVLLPRVSRHVLAGSTLGLKAGVGWLRDDSRLELHRDAESFLEKTAEINDSAVLRQKLRLTLSVATKVQTTFGPDRGFSAEPDPGLIFGSESLLAHDMVSLGWLLWCRERATPPGQLSWYRDPYVAYPGMMNRLFVGYIWGLGSFINSETYSTIPIDSVSADPVIARAASIWGGLPRLELERATTGFPDDVVQYLQEKASS